MILALLASVALAGGMADGLLGFSWGPLNPFPPPGKNCKPNPEPTTRWGGCEQKLADIPAYVSYGYHNGILFAIVVRVKGYPYCRELLAAADAAWGTPFKEENPLTHSLPTKHWIEDNVIVGTFEETPVSYTNCTLAVVHTEWSEKSRAVGTEVEKARKDAL